MLVPELLQLIHMLFSNLLHQLIPLISWCRWYPHRKSRLSGKHHPTQITPKIQALTKAIREKMICLPGIPLTKQMIRKLGKTITKIKIGPVPNQKLQCNHGYLVLFGTTFLFFSVDSLMTTHHHTQIGLLTLREIVRDGRIRILDMMLMKLDPQGLSVAHISLVQWLILLETSGAQNLTRNHHPMFIPKRFAVCLMKSDLLGRTDSQSTTKAPLTMFLIPI